MLEIVSKLLRAAIWSCCAVQFKSEQTPFSRTGSWFRSAALHRIWFRICCFVPMSYFYSETNDWSKDWAKWGAALVCINILPIPFKNSFHIKKKWLVVQSIKAFLTLDLSQYRKSGGMFSSSKQVMARSDCCWLRNTLCLCLPVQPARVLSLSPCHCNDHLQLEIDTLPGCQCHYWTWSLGWLLVW